MTRSVPRGAASTRSRSCSETPLERRARRWEDRTLSTWNSEQHQRPAGLPEDFTPFEDEDVEGTITDRFRGIVSKHSERVAIDDGQRVLTYAELDRITDHVAARILERLGSLSEPVALLYGRHGTPFNIGQLSVIKAGKFYASLDAELSANRLSLLLQNLGARLILCDSSCAALARELCREAPEATVLSTETLGTLTQTRLPDLDLSADTLAYVVYTSGSTGEPKGVMVSHGNVLHAIQERVNNLHIRPCDRASEVCHLASVACSSETWAALLSGAMLLPCSVKGGGIMNIPRLLRWLKQKRVTIFTAVPVLFRLLVGGMREDERLPDIRLVCLSGDRILAKDVALLRHFSNDCLLRATLGASECLLYTQFFVDASYRTTRQTIPAGYPLKDMEVFIVDDEMNRLPAGQRGEIAVRSKYLSAGYWQDPQLTAERFRDGPEDETKRVYLTRDYGYIEQDGCLVHLGRTDFHVKIYGKLVSITDVEETLLALPDVKEAVVVARDTVSLGHVLIAYYTSATNANLADDVLRASLLDRFPVEIVPKEFVRLDRMPLTPGNKIDRAKLAADDARGGK